MLKMYHFCIVKSLYLAISFVLMSGFLFAQYPLKGIVMAEGKPLEFASVALPSALKGTLTNARGEFNLGDFAEGKYTLNITCIGYEKQAITILLNKQTAPQVINMVPLKSSLEEVTISGTLSEVIRSQSAVPVEIYNNKYFQKNPSSNLFENVQMINGVLPTLNCNVCNTGDIHINGLDGPFTLVLIDGMPIVSALSTVYGLMGIPSEMIERVEVVKGPAATLYGSEAVAGLINVITKNPSKAPRVSASYFGTSYLENNLDVGFGRPKNLSFLLSGNYYRYNHKVDLNHDNFTDVTLQNRYSVFGKLAWNRNNGQQSTLAIRYFNENRFGGEMNWEEAYRGGDSIYGESIYTKRYELIGSHPFQLAGIPLKLQLSANWHFQDAAYGNMLYLGKQGTGFGQLLHQRKAGKKHQLLSGLAMRYTWYDDNTTATEQNLLNKPSVVWLPGVFVQDEITGNRRNTVLLGARADYHPSHGLILSPRVNIKSGVSANGTLRLSLGNGFRVVNLFTEDHAALTGARQVVIEGNLSPEKSWNANLQYAHFFNSRHGYFEWDITGFYTWFGNKIIPDYDTDPNLIIYRNLDEHAVSTGVSINVNYHADFGLKLNGGATLMKVYAVVADSNGQSQKVDQIHAPGFSGVFGVSYTFKKLRGIWVDYTGQVYGPMRLPVLPNDFRPEYSPWFTLQNVQLSGKINKQFETFVGVKNIFNFMPENPIMRWWDPFDRQVNDPVNNPNGYTFDPSYNYAPLMARRLYLGLRYILR